MDPITIPDFNQYELALVHEGNVVYSSPEQGLQPLLDCIGACRGVYRNCVLHDRVFGLAAARLVAPEGIVQTVATQIVSRLALTFMEAHQIEVRAVQVVDDIPASGGKAVCPEEIIALEAEDLPTFRRRIQEMLKG